MRSILNTMLLAFGTLQLSTPGQAADLSDNVTIYLLQKNEGRL